MTTTCPVCGHDMRDACAPCAERAALVESRREGHRKWLDRKPDDDIELPNAQEGKP